MANIKLVIFDCDGVLVDSEFIAARHEARRYGEYGLEIGVQEFAGRFAGMTGEAVFEAVQEELGRSLPAKLFEEIEGELDDVLNREVEAVAGAVAVLDRIDHARCICSNSSAQRLKGMLTRTGLYDRFRPYIFSARDLDPPAPKPLPDIYLKAVAEFGVEPREAVVIEDSVHGVTGAARAGTRVIGFTGGRHSYPMHGDLLAEAGAETVIGNFRDLPATIEAFETWEGLGAA